MIDDSDRLKPCPFCGGAAEMGCVRSESGEEPNEGGYFIACLACDASTGLRFACGDDPKPLLIEQWNRRTALAQQAEPVDVGLLEYRGNSVAFIHQKMTAYRAGIDAAWDAFRAKGLHPDGKTSLADMIAKYTAPPQRLPLTEEEIDKIFKHLCNTVGASCKTMARAVERTHGIKE